MIHIGAPKYYPHPLHRNGLFYIFTKNSSYKIIGDTEKGSGKNIFAKLTFFETWLNAGLREWGDRNKKGWGGGNCVGVTTNLG